MQDVRSEVKEGDQVLVKVVNIDPSGKIRLSRKALLTEAEGGGARPGAGRCEAAATAAGGGGVRPAAASTGAAAGTAAGGRRAGPRS